MELNRLESLLEDQLKDLYSAENQLVKVLPRMARAASSSSLREAFERHAEQTRDQIERLKQIGSSLGVSLGGKRCYAMEGLIEEGNEVMKAEGEGTLIDAALVGAAQRTEHYEISAYGTARAMAERLGLSEIAEMLQRTLDEESETDELLTRISVGELLPSVRMGEEAEEEGEEEEEEVGRRRTPGRTRTSRAKAGTARGGGGGARGARRSRAGGGGRSTSRAATGSGGRSKSKAGSAGRGTTRSGGSRSGSRGGTASARGSSRR